MMFKLNSWIFPALALTGAIDTSFAPVKLFLAK
jgi:hypothetical protein